MKRFFLFVLCGYCFAACGNRQIYRNLEELYKATILPPPDNLEIVIGRLPEKDIGGGNADQINFLLSVESLLGLYGQSNRKKWEPIFDSIATARSNGIRPQTKSGLRSAKKLQSPYFKEN